MRFTADKDLNQLIKQLCKQGWLFEKRKKHAMLVPPDGKGKKICVAITPRTHRSCAYVRSKLKHLSD